MNNLEIDYVRRVKKFNIDDVADRDEYEKLLNNDEVVIERDQLSFDRTKGNQALLVVWWREPKQ